MNGGTNVNITTGAYGGEAGTITVDSAINKTFGANIPTLTLNAAGSIAIDNTIGFSGSASGFECSINIRRSITQTAPITATNLTATAGAAPITLTNSGNAISGSVALSNSGANNVSFTNSMATNLATSSAGGDFTVNSGGPLTVSGSLTTAGGAISLTADGTNNMLTISNGASVSSNGGAITYAADNMTLAGSTNSGSGLVTLVPVTSTTAIQLGEGATNGAGVLGIDNAELNTITSTGGLTIGSSSFTGGITVVGAASPANVTGGILTLSNSGPIAFNAGLKSAVDVTAISSNNNISFGSEGSVSAAGKTVTLSAMNGSITGNGGNNTNVTAGTLIVNAKNGVGSISGANPITSAVSYLSGSNSTSGDIDIHNLGALIVNNAGVNNYGAGNVQIVDNSSITNNSPISTTGSGTIFLAGSLLILNANLSGGTGSTVNLSSGSTINQTGGTISTTNLDVDSVNTATLTANNVVADIAASISGLSAGNNFIFTDTPPPAVTLNIATIGSDSGISNSSSNGVVSIVNNNGNIQVNNPITSAGGVSLSAPGNDITINSVISARGGNGQVGGTVTITGSNIVLDPSTVIDVSGGTGGGNIYVGGNAHGAGPLPDAETVVVAPGANLYANAITNGNGGNVVVWSNLGTEFYGNIYAQGGSQAGNGGWVETSGKAYLDAAGTVDASAPNGISGSWLLDPYNISIGSSDNNYTSNSSAGTITYTSSGNSSTISTTTIKNELNGGTNVVIQTGGASAQDGDINVTSALTSTAGSGITLTLTAGTGGTNPGNINITTGGATINGGFNLILNTTGGTVSIGEALGGTTALASLTVNSASTISANVTTSGAQLYTGAATLGANATLTTSNNNVTFDSTVTGTSSGGQSLTVAAGSGVVTFTGVVGATALSALTVTGPTTLDANVTTTGGQTYNSAVTVGGTDTLTTTNNAVHFVSTVNGANALTIAAGTGTVTLGGIVGGSTSLT